MEFYLSALILGLCLSSVALGIFISMKIFRIPDITTDGSYTLGAVTTALLLTHHCPLSLAIPITLVAGGLAGCLTGLIHTKLKIDALLAGILVMTALYSVNLSLLGRSTLPLVNIPTIFSFWPSGGTYSQLLVVCLFLLALTLLLSYLLRTDFGVAMRATGDSESMTRALGINNDFMKIIGLGIANALTALGGFLVAQYQGFTDINMGIGVVIVGLGSVLISDRLIRWFRIRPIWLQLPVVILGSLVFQFVLAFTLSIGVDPNLLKLVTALFVLAIVGAPALRLKRTA
ncbi:ABC transporter permease [Dinghuibacter silviterrae]|uniref:Putative ABC transport system permease protein n=1 Tax=Dinghuibacter silviterrae TaxID=1539049 RepID=A0A4R8DGQ7_9BACT|nr:ABC transporter permease [Dinghuibacter silviterrae]TDW96647.1 putative ABC transport system permease protein [Dinghuibacter silviterrae]